MDLNLFISVISEVRKVRMGEVLTYGEVARRVGKPNAARAVGRVLRENPMPILVPCHRIVAKQGIGGYVYGEEVKKRILEIEGAMQTIFKRD